MAGSVWRTAGSVWSVASGMWQAVHVGEIKTSVDMVVCIISFLLPPWYHFIIHQGQGVNN
jgi:hypothetical protein